MNEYILKLDDKGVVLATAGGKGASLARLAAAGLPVPDGFHISTGAYCDFVSHNDLQRDINAALQGLDALSNPAALEQASKAIQARFAVGHIPQHMAQAVTEAYAALAPHDEPVAVRSSATAEDLPEMSFAGQQDTYLNISGKDELLQAVQRCWASLWTARAIAYRLRHHIDSRDVSLAVVVQLLVPAEAAGVLFSANPLNNRRDQVVINAAWGLGEAVVGGLVTPDTLTVARGNGHIIRRETACKQLMTVRLPGGHTQEQPVPQKMQLMQVLDDRQAAELAGLAVRIEGLFAVPVDIEWALAKGKFYILQARPITTLATEAEISPPTDWPLPREGTSYTRTSIIDYLADPLTPLFATMGRETYNRAMQKLVSDLFGIDRGYTSDMVTINGYAYFNIQFNAWTMLLLTLRMAATMPGLLRTAARRWQEQAIPEYQAAVSRWQALPLEQVAAARLMEGAADIFSHTTAYLTHIQSGSLGAAMFSESVFTFVYQRFIKGKNGEPASNFLLGFDSLPILAEKSLFDMAQDIQQTPALAAYLSEAPVEDILSLYRSGQAPEAVHEETWQDWSDRFTAYLSKYGHNIYDLDFAKNLPQDEPLPLLNNLKLYLQGTGRNPYRRQEEAVIKRQQAADDVRSRTRWLRRKIFDKLLAFAQKNVTLREDSIACIGLGYPQLRAMLLELGRRLQQAGFVEKAADIFWLEQDEAWQYADGLDNRRALPPLHEEICQRKAVWRAEKKVTPPPVLPLKGKVLGMDGQMWASAQVDDGSSNTIKGVAASPGLTSAHACVLHGPEEFGKMKHGDVLVAAITTPAWTPLFSLASAVVTDIGGPLSHGSIVAREYGIPAVLGTGSATRRIHDGQLITVDGSAGRVTLAEAETHG